MRLIRDRGIVIGFLRVRIGVGRMGGCCRMLLIRGMFGGSLWRGLYDILFWARGWSAGVVAVE